jgi:hypothetical protein
LIYDASQQDVAEFYAPRLESHLQTLKPYFTHFPEKIAFVLNDNSDLTNGFATPFPYDQVQVFPVLPGPQESIGEYGDWAHEVSLHEYVHVLSFQPRRGVVKVLHTVLGSVITPNMLLPRWFMEGLAVDFETRFSTHGRLRSSHQDASLRALSIAGRLSEFNLAEINETSLHTYPQGARPYLFGSLMWSDMIKDTKVESADTLLKSYGGRIPFFLNGPAKDYIGKSYEDQLAQSLAETETRIQSQISQLKSETPSAFENLNWNVPETFSPAVSPDGRKLAYISRGEHLRRGVKILERENLNVPFRAEDAKDVFQQKDGEGGTESSPIPRNEHDGPPGGTISRLFWFPHSQKILYDRVDSRNRYHERSDLHIYDIQTRKSQQISFGLRAREAAVSPDSKWAVFVQLQANRSALTLMNLQKKTIKPLRLFEAQERVSWPSYLDSENIIFSLRKKGNDSLHIYNLPSGSLREVLTEYKDSLFADVSKQGVFFSSTQNGVRNLYLAAPDLQSAKAITHSLTGVGSSSLDEKLQEIYVSEMTGDGLKIRHLPLKARFKGKQLPVISGLYSDRYSNKTLPSLPAVSG